MSEDPCHIVAVTAVVLNASGQVLLVRTPRRGWEPPGGQVESGEHLEAALHREVREESGCQVRIERLIGVYSNVGTPPRVILCFRCRYTVGVPTAGHECVDAGWFPPEDALEMVSHAASRARLADALAAHGHVVYRAYSTHPFRLRHTADW